MLEERSSPRRYLVAQRVGLLLGGGIFFLLIVIPAPSGLSVEGWRTAAVAILMAIWWMTEAIPIPATAILPLGLFPTLGVLDAESASAPYANELIFLFMGGFILARTMEKWGLHKRIALEIMLFVGTAPNRLILGFMIATAFLSMWISNTAATALMLPIAFAVGEMFRPKGHEGLFNFGVALMLGVAYAASIGGVITLIGTPPNAVLAGAAREILGVEIGFIQWMGVGLPVALVMLPFAWIVLTRVLYPSGDLIGNGSEIIEGERLALGATSKGEKLTGTVFALTTLGWVMRSEKTMGGVTIYGLQTLSPNLRDSTIVMIAVAVLFILPVDWKKGEFTLDWRTARRIPWGVLLLFGGGLSLARAMDQSGLAAWIGGGVGLLPPMPVLIIVAVVVTLVVFLTELTSNVATTSMAMPIMAGVAIGFSMEPLLLMTTAALAASMAFMLPVATPPNAIVFGSGYITISQMSRAGFILNLCAIVLISWFGSFLIPFFLLN